MSSLLRANGIVKEYAQGPARLRVLRGVSLSVAEGEFLVIIGASGAGKSTLLHILGLLDSPDSGELYLEEESLTPLSARKQSELRNNLFGFVFQFFHLLPDFNALDNVMMPALVGRTIRDWGKAKSESRARALELLRKVGLEARTHHRPNQLSGGERQRVALCRALMNKPRVLLLDEPTGNLDSKTGAQINEIIHDLHKNERQTIIMVTHDESAARKADRIIHIRDGELI